MTPHPFTCLHLLLISALAIGCGESCDNQARVAPRHRLVGDLILHRDHVVRIADSDVHRLRRWGLVVPEGPYLCSGDWCKSSMRSFSPDWGLRANEILADSVFVECEQPPCETGPVDAVLAATRLDSRGTLFSVSADRLIVADDPSFQVAYGVAMEIALPECTPRVRDMLANFASPPVSHDAMELIACIGVPYPLDTISVTVREGSEVVEDGFVSDASVLANHILTLRGGAVLCPELEAIDVFAEPAPVRAACQRRWLTALQLIPALVDCADCRAEWRSIGFAPSR